jgi:hypothetical protein
MAKQYLDSGIANLNTGNRGQEILRFRYYQIDGIALAFNPRAEIVALIPLGDAPMRIC